MLILWVWLIPSSAYKLKLRLCVKANKGSRLQLEPKYTAATGTISKNIQFINISAKNQENHIDLFTGHLIVQLNQLHVYFLCVALVDI